MKRIIDGVTYNTDTSTMVALFDQPASHHNPTSKTGTLYQTRGGAFFVHWREEWNYKEEGEWATKTNDSFEVMTYDEAHKWVLDGDVEIFSGVFPDPPEATSEEKPGATIYIRVPQSLKARIDDASDEAKLSINAWSMRCIEQCLNTDEDAADSLGRANYIAVSVNALPDGYSTKQLHTALVDIAELIADAWGELHLPRVKGVDLEEDVFLYASEGIIGSDDSFRREWEPYQHE